jgi:hypothetical protein
MHACMHRNPISYILFYSILYTKLTSLFSHTYTHPSLSYPTLPLPGQPASCQSAVKLSICLSVYLQCALPPSYEAALDPDPDPTAHLPTEDPQVSPRTLMHSCMHPYPIPYTLYPTLISISYLKYTYVLTSLFSFISPTPHLYPPLPSLPLHV